MVRQRWWTGLVILVLLFGGLILGLFWNDSVVDDLRPGDRNLTDVDAQPRRGTTDASKSPEGEAASSEADSGTLKNSSGRFLSGRVIDEDGNPVGNAAVVALPAGALELSALVVDDSKPEGRESQEMRATTDIQGHFVLDVLDGTELVTIAAHSPDFAPSSPVDIVVGQQDVELVLRRGFLLHGRVHDLEGVPVAGAELKLVSQLRTIVVECRAVSDEDGNYRLIGIPDYNPLDSSQSTDSLVVEAGGFAQRFIRNPIDSETRRLRGAGEVVLDICLTRGGTVTGTVFEGQGRPRIARIEVELWSLEGRDFVPVLGRSRQLAATTGPRLIGRTKTDAEGRFRFDNVPASYGGLFVPDGLMDGPFTVCVRRTGSAIAAVPVPALERDGEARDVEVVLHHAIGLRGRLVDREGEPVEGMFLAFSVFDWREVPLDITRASLSAPTPRLDRMGWLAAEGKRGLWTTRSDSRGCFANPLLPCLPGRPTRFQLHLEGNQREFHVAEGQTFDLGDLVVRRNTGILHGRVLNDHREAIHGAEVWCHENRAMTNAEGSFALELELSSNGSLSKEDLRIQCPGYAPLHTFSPDALTDGVQDFVLQDEHVLAGRVIDASGRPVAHARILVTVANDGSRGWVWSDHLAAGTSDPDGHFRIGELPDPPWDLSFASALDRLESEQKGISHDADDLVLELPGTVPPLGSFKVRVTDRQGAAIVAPIFASLKSEAGGRTFEAHRMSLDMLEWQKLPIDRYRLEVRTPGLCQFECEVSLKTTSSDPLQVVLVPGVDVAVQLLLPEGAADSVTWRIRAIHEDQGIRRATGTGSSGSKINDMAPGLWFFSAEAEDKDGHVYLAEPRQQDLVAGEQPKVVEMVLVEAARLCVQLSLRQDEDPQFPQMNEGPGNRAFADNHQSWWNLYYLYERRARELRLVLSRGERIVFNGVPTGLGKLEHDAGGQRIRGRVAPGHYAVELFHGENLLWRRSLDVEPGQVIDLP